MSVECVEAFDGACRLEFRLCRCVLAATVLLHLLSSATIVISPVVLSIVQDDVLGKLRVGQAASHHEAWRQRPSTSGRLPAGIYQQTCPANCHKIDNGFVAG